ncbi:MAG: sigma-70 family RNA polymerase sigma factor [Burkholderiales bacterium]
MAQEGESAASARIERLIGLIALKDRAAFKQLYDATVQCLFAIVTRLLRDRSWAEEVVQEAYVSIWNSAGNYSAAKSQPMTWLITIARNRATDALRSTTSERENVVHSALPEDDEGEPAREFADESAGVLDSLISRIDAVRLRGCLQALEAAQRQALALAFYDGLSHSELAAHMRQPLGTVKAWVRRGLDRLKHCLDS